MAEKPRIIFLIPTVMKCQLYTFLLASIILITGCNSSEEKKTNSGAISIVDVPEQRNDSSNRTLGIENVVGSWFQPHNAGINIQFQKDGRFEFNDYNAKLDKS